MTVLDWDHRVAVIGEVGQAHDGSLGTAHAFIDAIADAGADAVKFQTHIAAAESRTDEPWRVAFSYPLFAHYGIPLWVPEVGGAIDTDNEAHDLIMSVFDGVSKGERNRIRVRAAMATQAQIEGRYLGGRPPYGYLLIDAGPHPNPSKAADGKRLRVPAIDERAAQKTRTPHPTPRARATSPNRGTTPREPGGGPPGSPVR